MRLIYDWISIEDEKKDEYDALGNLYRKDKEICKKLKKIKCVIL